MGSAHYPKKYWWIILVVVPLVGGLIAVLPGVVPGGKNSGEKPVGAVTQVGTGNVNIMGSDLSQKTYFINVAAIARELKESGNQTLTDDLRQQIEKAIELSQSGQLEESIRIWQELATKVPVASVHYNLAVANARAGKTGDASREFQKALVQKPDFPAARSALALLEAAPSKPPEAAARTGETEPNDDLFQANGITLNTTVPGLITNSADKDFYKFTTPPIYRDVIRVTLDNQSSTLRAELALFDARKSQVGGSTYDTTPGANLEKSFVAPPQTTFYLRVAAFGDFHGAYLLLIEPQKAYDAFEPNEVILNARPIELGRRIEANILDSGDMDFYRLKAPAGGKSRKLQVQNLSTTLRPQATAFDAQKSEISSTYKTTPGADLDLVFDTTPGADFYVRINSFGDFPGAYALVVE